MRNENERVSKGDFIGDGKIISLLSFGRKASVWVDSDWFKAVVESLKLSSSRRFKVRLELITVI